MLKDALFAVNQILPGDSFNKRFAQGGNIYLFEPIGLGFLAPGSMPVTGFAQPTIIVPTVSLTGDLDAAEVDGFAEYTQAIQKGGKLQ